MQKFLATLAIQVVPLFISSHPSLAQTGAIRDSTAVGVAESIYNDSLKWRPCAGGSLQGCEVHVLRGVLENGPSEVFIRFARGTRVPTFKHSVTERGLLLAGKLVGMDAQGREITVLPGTYWYIPAGTVHGGLRCSDEGACLIYEGYSGTFDFEIVVRPSNTR